MRTCIVIAVCACIALSATAQETLTNGEIVEMHRLGLGTEVLIGKITTTASSFDVSVGSLSALKNAGVPDVVIAAMITKSHTPADSLRDHASIDPHDPIAPHPPGIYVQEDGRLVKLEASCRVCAVPRGL